MLAKQCHFGLKGLFCEVKAISADRVLLLRVLFSRHANQNAKKQPL
jgi:hypothetical protein